MKMTWTVRIFEILLLATIVIAGFGQAVLQLWNLLMPTIFRLPVITFWQAVGLIGLSWILFGGLGMFRVAGGQGQWKHRVAERLDRMDPEQRERLRQSLEHRCGGPKGPAGA